ncbi:MAG TPA: hypothetical protein VI279_16610 [Rhodocyclaceae bacterium]
MRPPPGHPVVAEEAWRRGLPSAWRDAVVAPLWFRRFEDYEAAASRRVGYDEDGLPCWCDYRYRLEALRSDDGEDFYAETLYAESGRSWRLRDGRWLHYREVLGEEREGRGFFCLGEEAPR